MMQKNETYNIIEFIVLYLEVVEYRDFQQEEHMDWQEVLHQLLQNRKEGQLVVVLAVYSSVKTKCINH